MKKTIRNIKEAFSYTTQVGGTTWDPTKDRAPFRVMTGLGHIEDVLRDGGIKREEEEAKAPKILPFPLDRIIDQLAKNYETLIALRITLLTSIRSALLSKQDKTLLKHNLKRIDYMINMIKKMSSDVERVHL